jgi:hypothetical protein
LLMLYLTYDWFDKTVWNSLRISSKKNYLWSMID